MSFGLMTSWTDSIPLISSAALSNFVCVYPIFDACSIIVAQILDLRICRVTQQRVTDGDPNKNFDILRTLISTKP